MSIRKKLRTMLCRGMSIWHIITGKIEQGNLEKLNQGRGCKPCMSEESQMIRWKSLYKVLEIRIKNPLQFKQRIYDLRDGNGDCRYILVPKELTVEELVKIIKKKTNNFEIAVQGLGNLEGLKDIRSNACTSYLLKVTDVDKNTSLGNSTIISNYTVLERLLYYVMVYWESGSLNKINTSVICSGTYDGRFLAEIRTKVTRNDSGEIIIWLDISRVSNLL